MLSAPGCKPVLHILSSNGTYTSMKSKTISKIESFVKMNDDYFLIVMF